MDYRKEYEKWLASPALSEDERAELKALEGNDKEIKARFYGPLEFGTAGLRGTMYTGLHNMNRHVIRWATQGFANVIRAEGTEAMKKGVAVCMDCRNHSAEFARETACVMAANGIHVRLFESLRPTPELSFAVREYGCQAGVNVTASHNPKEYNGYKVYWADGAQLPPQHAAAIADELTRIDIFTGVQSMDYEQALAEGRIELLGEDCDRRFMANVMGMVNDYETVKKVADDFGLVYTPFHGCGYKLVPEALRRLGIKHLYPVEQQMVERLAAHARRLHEDAQILHDLLLPGKRLEAPRAQRALIVAVALHSAVVYVEFLLVHNFCILQIYAFPANLQAPPRSLSSLQPLNSLNFLKSLLSLQLRPAVGCLLGFLSYLSYLCLGLGQRAQNLPHCLLIC